MFEPKITDNYDGTYTVRRNCVRCKCESVGVVTGPELFAYRQGSFVQDAFPSLHAAQREALFISGVCPVCWDEMFSDEEDC